MKKKLIVFLTIISLNLTCYSYAGEEEEGELDKANEKEEYGQITADIFGRKGGYIHPFFSITELYSDNIFNNNTNTVSDYATVLSPGIWLAIPGTREQVLEIDASSATAGGLDYDIAQRRYPRRFQSYMMFASDIAIYSDESEADTEDYWLEGFLQYNLAGGLSVELIDQFAASHDEWRTGTSTELDKFKNNLFTTRVTYDLSDKFRIRADYTNYNVNYDATRNDSRDRTDNSFSGFFSFNFRPKYSLFAKYEYINVEYDTDSSRDHESHRISGGLDWTISAKSTGRFQAGYTIKEFDDPTVEEDNEFILRARIRHRFTSKTFLVLNAYRQIRESYIGSLNDMLTHQVSARYSQRMTSKIIANLELSYTEDDYSGLLTVGSETKEREDTFYIAGPSLEYYFRKWINAQVAYEYSERDSSFTDFDYTTNTFFIRINVSL